ncbi:ABC transporter substrate-binding protein [Devosia sp. A449]
MELNRRKFLVGSSAALAVTQFGLPAYAAESLNYWHHFTSQTEIAGLEAVIQAFHAKYPEISLQHETIPLPEYLAKITNAVIANARADTCMIQENNAADMLALGAALDISDRIQAAGFYDNYAPKVWDGVTRDGKQYAVPFASMVTQAFYRKDRFDELGLTPPTNFEEFVEVAAKLTDPSKDQYGFCMRGGAGGDGFVIMIMQAFGNKIVEDGKMALDKAKVVAALDWYSSLYTKHKVCQPSAPADSFGQIFQSFKTGNTSMIWYHTGATKEFVDALGRDKIGTALVPKGPEAHAIPMTNLYTSMMSDRNPDLAWKWLEFWATPEAALALFNQNGHYPANQELAKLPEIANNELYASAPEGYEKGTQTLSFPGQTPWRMTVVLPEFQKLLLGLTTPEDAADAMIRGLESALAS